MGVNNTLLAPVMFDHIRMADVKLMNSNAIYTYKCGFPEIEVDDVVVLETRHGMTLGTVTEFVDLPDTDDDIKYKWIVGRVDKARVELMMDQEKALIERINSMKAVSVRDQIRAALGIHTDEDLAKLQFEVSGIKPNSD